MSLSPDGQFSAWIAGATVVGSIATALIMKLTPSTRDKIDANGKLIEELNKQNKQLMEQVGMLWARVNELTEECEQLRSTAETAHTETMRLADEHRTCRTELDTMRLNYEKLQGDLKLLRIALDKETE